MQRTTIFKLIPTRGEGTTIDELKAKVESHRAALKEKSGYTESFYQNGPASMGLIHALVSVLEAQERRIVALEKRDLR